MFSRLFIERPRLAIVLSIVMVLSGLIALTHLPVAEYPEITPPTLYVSATYTGASADVVAQTVAMPLEDEINGVENLLYFSSSSSNEGAYACTVTFRTGTNSDIALVNLQNAVKRAEARLPSEVTKIGVTVEKRGNDTLAMLAFSTDGSSMSLPELTNYVNNNVKDALARLEGVSSVSMVSQDEYAMRIWLDPLRMNGLGISTDDVRTAVEAQNIQAAAGTIGSEGSGRYVAYKLNVQGRLRTADEFGGIIVRSDTEEGSVVRLRDVARVELGSRTYSGKAMYNGVNTVGVSIYRSPDANALATMNRVKAELKTWSARFPQGVRYDYAYDPTLFITVSMQEMVSTLGMALLLVVLVTWGFLQDWRATLIPSVAIPVSLLGTFSIFYALGYSINTLTMFGLILVIGSLVDDAIVVVENTQGLMEREGLEPKAAALKGMTQITGAVIATTLVTVACYVPLAFYGGMVGAIYRQFAVSMCVSLCLSAVVALTLSPVMCALVLRRPEGKTSPLSRSVNSLLDFIRGRYLGCVGFLIRRGMLTTLLFSGIACATWALYGTIPGSFLPTEDKGVIMCNIELPGDSSRLRTEEVMEQLRQRLLAIPGIRSSMLVTGMSMMSGSGENVGMCIAQLDDWDKRTSPETQLSAIMTEVQKRTHDIAAANIVCFTPPAIMGLGVTGGASFNICGIGDVNTGELSELSGKFVHDLSGKPETLYAMSSYNADTPQLRLNLNREKTQLLGVSAKTVFVTLQDTLASLYINDFTTKGSNFEVKMQSDRSFRGSLRDVREILVPATDGSMVPLNALGTLSYEVGPRQITRFNKMTSAEISAQAFPGVSSGTFFSTIESMPLPVGYHLEWTGLSYQEKQNSGQIVLLMGLALLFAYLFLVVQYESWSIPLPVMLTVLFALFGALLGLLVTRGDMSIYAQLGMVMLIGLSAKSAILMVEFSKQEREGGKSVEESALSGAKLRFRAVMMTAWSFLFGVMPLLTATGAGAASRRAIGITTFSGMLMATLVGVIFTPALYVIFQNLRERTKAFLQQRKYPQHISGCVLLCLIFSSLLTGCAVGPDFKRADTNLPDTFLSGTLPDSGKALRPNWWEDFQDPLLSSLVSEAQNGSLSVQQAIQRVAQARAASRQARSELLPNGNASGTIERARSMNPDRTATTLDASAELALALDVFGGLRRSLEAAQADLEATGISLADARTTLAEEVATKYVNLRLAQENLRIARENTSVQEDTVRISQNKLDVGTGSPLDVYSAKAQLETTRASIPTAEADITAAIRGLEALAGEKPGAYDAKLRAVAPIPHLTKLFTAVPSDLLRRRPDVRKAEAEHHAATARIGVAEAEYFPSFSLTGSAVFTSSALKSWSDVMQTFGIGGGSNWNFLAFGRTKAAVDQSRAAATESALAYRETVLNALHDVETSWNALDREKARSVPLSTALDFQKKALELSRAMYEVGKSDYLKVLTAQSSYLSAQKDLATHSANIAQDEISLIKALGGGWDGTMEKTVR